MKKLWDKNIILGILLLIVAGLVLGTYKLTYSVSNVVAFEDDKEEIDSELVWNFLSKAEKDEVKESIEENFDMELVSTAIVNDVEDPNTVSQEEVEEIKGVAKSTTVKEAVKTYETNDTSLGIDVSSWQGKIDWKKVKEAGINFAMIRCGYRRLNSGEIVMDNYFLDNIKGALANQINVGVYFYSVANSTEEALEEAVWVYNVIKDYDITYPVAIDTEIFNRYRLEGVSYSVLTNNALVFCDYIKSKGYTPMIYSYSNAFTKYFETAKFEEQRIWLAQYNEEVTYQGKYHMWQYTSDGSVPGISGRVDMDVAYFSVTNDVTKAETVNGINNRGDLEEVLFTELNMVTTLSKDVMLRSSPYNNLPNKAGILESGTEIVVTGLSDNYTRITYNEDTFYVEGKDFFIYNLPEVSFKESKFKIKVTAEIEYFISPYIYLDDNKAGFLEIDEELVVDGFNEEWTRIVKDDNVYYIHAVDFYDVLEDLEYEGSNILEEDLVGDDE